METLRESPDGRKVAVCAIGDDYDPTCEHAFARQKNGKIDRRCVKCGWVPLARVDEGRVIVEAQGASISVRTALALWRDLGVALSALGVLTSTAP